MADNKPKLSVEFAIEEIPLMWHAMNLQAGTDLCYGSEGRVSREIFKEKANRLRDAYPLICKHGLSEYGWLNALTVAKTAKEVELSQKAELDWDHYSKSDYTERRVATDWLKTHPIIVRVDDKYFKLSDRIPYNRDYLIALRELITEVIPLDCKLHEIAELKLER
jgi:hypothetical protein